jgi:hypothetical protein
MRRSCGSTHCTHYTLCADLVGLDTQVNELVDGTNLYSPSVSLDQVVLPALHKAELLQTVSDFQVSERLRVQEFGSTQ